MRKCAEVSEVLQNYVEDTEVDDTEAECLESAARQEKALALLDEKYDKEEKARKAAVEAKGTAEKKAEEAKKKAEKAKAESGQDRAERAER